MSYSNKSHHRWFDRFKHSKNLLCEHLKAQFRSLSFSTSASGEGIPFIHISLISSHYHFSSMWTTERNGNFAYTQRSLRNLVISHAMCFDSHALRLHFSFSIWFYDLQPKRTNSRNEERTFDGIMTFQYSIRTARMQLYYTQLILDTDAACVWFACTYAHRSIALAFHLYIYSYIQDLGPKSSSLCTCTLKKKWIRLSNR